MNLIDIYFAVDGKNIDGFLRSSEAIKQCNECDQEFAQGTYDLNYIFPGGFENGDRISARITQCLNRAKIELSPKDNSFEPKSDAIITYVIMYK